MCLFDQAVQNPDPVPGPQQFGADMPADEAGTPCDQDCAHAVVFPVSVRQALAAGL